MKSTVWSRLTLGPTVGPAAVLIAGLTASLGAGCREPGDERPAGGRAAPSLAPTAPPSVAPLKPAAQTAPVAADVGTALAAAAATCFPGERFDRRCPAFAQLRETTRARATDATWQAALQARVDAPGPEGRLALEVVVEGASPVAPEGAAALRGRLWRVVDDEARSPDQRAQAVRLMARLAQPEDVDRLLARVSGAAPAAVRAAVGYALAEPTPALAEARARTVPALLTALKTEPSGEAARGMIHTLGALRVEAAAPLLVDRLDDALVGATATLALAGLRDPRAFTAVMSRIEAGAAGEGAGAEGGAGEGGAGEGGAGEGAGGQGVVAPALLSALGPLEAHPGFDAARVRTALERLVKRLEPRGADAVAGISLDLARQTLRRLDALAAEAASRPDPGKGPSKAPAKDAGKGKRTGTGPARRTP